jgi:hypothetical protein
MAEITNAIVKHIFKNLGIFDDVPISIKNETFLTSEQISYSSDDGEKTAPVWACQTSVEGKKLSMICTSLIIPGEDHIDDTENFVVVKLAGQPAYGCYLLSAGFGTFIEAGFIATELKPKTWIPTTTFLQATFLAGMEQLRDLTSKYDAISSPEELFTLLKEFIVYHESTAIGEKNEG